MIPGIEIPPQYGWPFATALVLAFIGYLVQRALKNRPAPPTISEMWDRIQVLETNQLASNAREQAALNQANDARAEAAGLKKFIGEWITHLLRWDNGGRKGRMPLPTDADLSRLNISTTTEGNPE